MKTLLDERHAPVTSAMGFVEAPIERVANALVGWRRQLGNDTDVESIDEVFPNVL